MEVCEHGLATHKYCFRCIGGKPNINDGLLIARDKSSKLIHRAMPINTTTDQELLKLIYDDLKMRADDGVVNISGFIWDRLSKRVLDT